MFRNKSKIFFYLINEVILTIFYLVIFVDALKNKDKISKETARICITFSNSIMDFKYYL